MRQPSTQTTGHAVEKSLSVDLLCPKNIWTLVFENQEARDNWQKVFNLFIEFSILSFFFLNYWWNG